MSDVDDDNREFLRGRRSPFSHYSVDVGGRDTFWTRPSRPDHEGPRTRLPAAADNAAKSLQGATRDGQSPPPVPQKPRIWSLADVATSTTTASGGRRSPSQPLDVAARPPPPLPIGAPSLSLPPLPPAAFQPWPPNGISVHHRHGILPPPPPAASTSSPPATHRPMPPVANGLLRYAPYPVVVGGGGGGHPTSHAAVSHQLAAAAAAHAAAVNAAVQARLGGPAVPGELPSAAVGRCTSPPTQSRCWPSTVALKNLSGIVICSGAVLDLTLHVVFDFRPVYNLSCRSCRHDYVNILLTKKANSMLLEHITVCMLIVLKN